MTRARNPVTSDQANPHADVGPELRAMCACGAPVRIRKHGECLRCYNRRHGAEKRAGKLSKARCSECGATPVVVLRTLRCAACAQRARLAAKRVRSLSRPFVADREPSTYNAAHQRVRRVRGRASAWPCFECREPAAQWAYRPGSPRERVTVEVSGGTTRRRRWSPEPADYDPLCKSCHRSRDFGDGDARRADPARQREWRAASYARAVESTEGRQQYRDRKRRERRARSDPYQARAWAISQGYDIADKGALPGGVLQAWIDAGSPRTIDPEQASESPSTTG